MEGEVAMLEVGGWWRKGRARWGWWWRGGTGAVEVDVAVGVSGLVQHLLRELSEVTTVMRIIRMAQNSARSGKETEGKKRERKRERAVDRK